MGPLKVMTFNENEIKFKKILMILLLTPKFSFNHVTKCIQNPHKTSIKILLWTTTDYPPFNYNMTMDRLTKCPHNNCFATKNKQYFDDETDFDVLLFNVMDLKNIVLPKKRLPRQKYIFVSREPPTLFKPPLKFNGYFNLTWTYKALSDIPLRYVIVKNKEGKVIGPEKDNMQWIDYNQMKPISNKVKRKLKDKRQAVSWLVTNCYTPSRREVYVNMLEEELTKFNLKIDIYGRCKGKFCADNEEVCHAMIETDYYFYLAFENSFCEEYVTEKLLTATKHFTVPIVYGAANYTNYLPQGAYIDSRIGAPKVASLINESMYNKEKYYEYFKWRRYYSLHDPYETPDSDEVCGLCRFLNKNLAMTNRISVYDNITEFWAT